MKQLLILINWSLSLLGLSVDTEQSPLWVVLLMVGWFAGSSLLLKYAYRRGWLNDIVKRLKMDEL